MEFNGNTVSGGGTINEGDNVTAIVNISNGCSFVNWTENGIEVSKNLVYKFVATQNRNLVANFNTSTSINVFNNDVNFYPNPVSTTLYIDHAEGANIRIFNIQGQLIYNVKALGNQTTIDVAELKTNDLVFVHVTSGSNSSVFKLSVLE